MKKMTELDMMGNPCPIPVIRAKKALADPASDGVLVLVDNIVAVQNLEKMAKGMGYTFAYESEGDTRHRVRIGKAEGARPAAEAVIAPAAPQSLPVSGAQCLPAEGPATVLITKDCMGSGSDELGRILIKGFIFSLTELPVLPKAVIFINAGVRLAVAGSNVLADLQRLEEAGTTILACGTCLNFYELTEQLAVGQVTDMFGITSRLAAPGQLISL